jgi:hypothetical protein
VPSDSTITSACRPLESERQAREMPAVRAAYEAFRASPGVGRMAPHNLEGHAWRLRVRRRQPRRLRRTSRTHALSSPASSLVRVAADDRAHADCRIGADHGADRGGRSDELSESYRALVIWADGHGLHGIWALLFPLQLDTFIGVGELALFVGLADGWSVRSRIGAWAVTHAGLAFSIGGNIGHVVGHDLASRAAVAVPPLAAAAALSIGLGVLKRVVSTSARTATQGPDAEATQADGPAVPVALADEGAVADPVTAVDVAAMSADTDAGPDARPSAGRTSGSDT